MNNYSLNIDSRFRDKSIYTSASEFVYNIPENIDSKNVIKMQISSIEFPNTSYVFNSAHSTNYFKINDTTYIIDEGNYNTDDLMTSINNLIPAGITFSMGVQSGKISVDASAFGIPIKLEFPRIDEYKSLGQLCGFTEESYEFSDVITGENIPSVVGESYYFMKVNDIGSIYNKNFKYISKIVVSSPVFEHSYDSRRRFVNKTVHLNQPTKIGKLEISLHDYNNNLLDLNGIDFSFTLELTTINNLVLKKFKELTFFSEELLDIILREKMLEYFAKETEKDKVDDDKLVFKNSDISNTSLLEMKKKYDFNNDKYFNNNYSEDYFTNNDTRKKKDYFKYDEDD
jgi:hypothetical protein